MVVHRRHFQAAGEQARHYGRDFLIEQDEIAHDHRHVAHLLERRVRAQREASLDRYTFDGHVQVAAWHTDAEDVPRLQLA